MSDQTPPLWTPERLAYWCFRLNGFLTTENFIVHPDTGTNQRTDADMLAVRFAHRSENILEPMEDDPKVATCSTFANVIIAEVKTGTCFLNGPWTDSNAHNMHRVLKALGCVPDSALDAACEALYKEGFWHDNVTTIRLFALGELKSKGLAISEAQQVTWNEVIEFCAKRFQDYKKQKSSVGQWTNDGKKLRQLALREGLELEVRRLFGLPFRNLPTQRTTE